MAKLTAKGRKALPPGDFAGPGKSYPVEDKGHAKAAKARAAEFASPSLKAKVDAKANRVLKAKGGVADVSGKPKANMPIDPKTLGSMVNSLKSK